MKRAILFPAALRISTSAAICALALVFAGTAQAGPIGTYYLTDFQNSTSGLSTLDAIQGNLYVQNVSHRQRQESPIAVFGNLGVVRTTGYFAGGQGGEYTGVPGLTVIQDGTTYTNAITLGDQYFDGTTDGRSNYTVGYSNGTVIATDTSWGGFGTTLFATGHFNDRGITYDNRNNSLWIQNNTSGRITDYTLSGTQISFFDVANHGSSFTALAMDVDHTLWYYEDQSGTIQNYDTNGNYVGSAHYTGLFEALGGEIASADAATPEPASLTLLGIALASMAGYGWRRRKQPAIA